jgi:hypothetical protein
MCTIDKYSAKYMFVEKELKEKPQYHILPFTESVQIANGCVTASARAIVGHLGIDFDLEFLPELKKYNLGSPEDNHMLGIAVASQKFGLNATIHTTNELTSNMPASNFPTKAQEVHPKVIEDIRRLAKLNQLILLTGHYDQYNFFSSIKNAICGGQYVFPFLDWKRFDNESQQKWGNANHIPVIVGFDNYKLVIMDPALDKGRNRIEIDYIKLYESLLPEQQIVFIGKKPSKN